jgi:hypothetical protein
MKYVIFLLPFIILSSLKTNSNIIRKQNKTDNLNFIIKQLKRNSTSYDKEYKKKETYRNLKNFNETPYRNYNDYFSTKNKSIKLVKIKPVKSIKTKESRIYYMSLLNNPNLIYLDNQIIHNKNNSTNNDDNNNLSDSDQNQKISYEHMNFTLCGSAICNDAGGVCMGIDKCECLTGYLDQKDNSIFKCSYKQYDAKIAFFLEFFVGFGSGHFYVKRYFNGMLKFCIYLFLYLFAVVINLFFHYKRNENKEEIMIASENPYCRFARIMFMCSCFFTCIIWQISDSILFYSKFYNDGNDFPLYLYE